MHFWLFSYQWTSDQKNLTVGWQWTSAGKYEVYSKIRAVLLFIFRLQLVFVSKFSLITDSGNKSVRGSATKPFLGLEDNAAHYSNSFTPWDGRVKENEPTCQHYGTFACQTVQAHLKEWKPWEVEPFMPWDKMIIVTRNTIFWLHRITELAERVQVHIVVCAF